MSRLTFIGGTCPEGRPCPASWIDEDTGDVYVRAKVPDPDVAARIHVPEGEVLTRIPADAVDVTLPGLRSRDAESSGAG